MQNTITLSAAAKVTRDLTATYNQLYISLLQSIEWKSEAVTVEGIYQSVEILLYDAPVELKEQTRQNFINFIQDFSNLTGLSVVELS